MVTRLLHSTTLVLSVVLLACLAVDASGQNREKFLISAKAGGINAVTGEAKVHLKGGADWQQLTVTDDLEAGDIVQTEMGGRVEMLLNPGSYLRLGENSEFELVNNSLDNLELKLIRGTAIVEATGTGDSELLINITTPHANFAIVRHGLYRLNVVPDDATELIVRKGRVMLNDSHTKVNGGNKVIFSATAGLSVAKLEGDDKKDRDDIDHWSKGRADELAKANRRISDHMLSNAFTSFRYSDWMFSGYRSTGVWFFNPASRCYTFLPFYYGWGSPYGSSYTMAVFNPFYCCHTRPFYGNTTWPTVSNGSNTIPSGNAPGFRPEPQIREVSKPVRTFEGSPGMVPRGGSSKPDIRPDVVRPDRP
jgi:FecR protein